MVITVECYSGGDFHEGMAWVKGFNDKYALINKSGNLLTSFKYDRVSKFEEGVAYVGIIDDSNNDIIGLIDKNGRSTFDK